MKTLNESAGVFEVKNDIIVELLDIERQIKLLELKKEALRESIKEEMSLSNVKAIENVLATFTYVAPTSKNTFDNKKFQEELPDLYKKYSKVSAVKESLRITWKVATDAVVLVAEQAIRDDLIG